MPYQALIVSIVHKHASGRLVEAVSRPTERSTGRAKKLRAGYLSPYTNMKQPIRKY